MHPMTLFFTDKGDEVRFKAELFPTQTRVVRYFALVCILVWVIYIWSEEEAGGGDAVLYLRLAALPWLLLVVLLTFWSGFPAVFEPVLSITIFLVLSLSLISFSRSIVSLIHSNTT